jgi:hypothetical protein
MIAFHPSALAEIERARDWYEQKRDGLGVDLVDEVERVLALIETAPLSFARARENRLARRALLAVFRTPWFLHCWTMVTCSSLRWRTRNAGPGIGGGGYADKAWLNFSSGYPVAGFQRPRRLEYNRYLGYFESERARAASLSGVATRSPA